MKPGPLPATSLPIDEPFRYRDGLAHGVTAERLRGADLEKRIYGVRAAAGAASTLEGRCRMFIERLGPGVFFSHTTAARLLGLPIPFRLESDDRLHVTVVSPARAPHASGLVGHSRLVFEGDVEETRGIPHSSGPRAWCELARTLRLGELVAVGDALVNVRSPRCRPEDLADRAKRGDPLSSSRKLRVALPLLDGRSESPPESLLRVILAQAGLPAPRINYVVTTVLGPGGIRTDLAYPDLKFAIEYQGDYHRSREQWRRDMTRRSRLEALGWYVLEVNWDDLQNPEDLVARIRSLLARRR